MILPNRSGSANMAVAIARLATARIQPSRASRPEQLEHARVETDEFHEADFRNTAWWRQSLEQRLALATSERADP